MIENMNHGGRIALLGLPSEPFAIDWGKVVTHMLTMKGIYGREMFETWNSMSAMLQTSETLRTRIASIISDRYPARDWRAALRRGRIGRRGQGHPRLDRAVGTRNRAVGRSGRTCTER